MDERIRERLAELKAEYETGQKMMADLEAQQANLRETLLRISGAIQVIEEMLAVPPEEPSAGETSHSEA